MSRNQTKRPIRDKHSNKSQGLSRPFLKTFATVYPDPADRPWVSEDEVELEFGHFVTKVSVKSGCEISLILLFYNNLNHLVSIITTESYNLFFFRLADFELVSWF